MSDPSERPPRKTLAAAIASGDTGLLRKIAAERKGLTDQQRQTLTLLADLLDRAADKHGGRGF